MTEPVDGAFARALDFQRGTLELIAAEVTPIERGWLVRQPSLPMVWSVNQVQVAEPIDYAEALALAEEHLAELPYRHIVVDHEASGEGLEELFRAAGWRVDREVTMALTGEPDREVDTARVIEPSEQGALALMRRWTSEGPELKLKGEPLRQVVESSRLSWLARRATRLGVIGRDGALAAITMLYSDGTVAQVEDVYTIPGERRQGYARTTVTHAASLAVRAGHQLTFIIADDNDWPMQLYGRIGFEPVGRAWSFHRDIGGSAGAAGATSAPRRA
jgi:GNAT superfamily N-acetyltransferase